MTSMLLTLEEQKHLSSYVTKQLNYMFPDENTVSSLLLQQMLPKTLERLEYCFSHIADRYFFDGEKIFFSYLHGDQYGMFLYFLSNTLYRAGENPAVCSKLFALNKALHGIDAFYEVTLPDIFRWVHPLGTVLGRGEYSDFFLVYQRCSIGANHGVYPKLGAFCSMHPGSSVLGNCSIGNYCELGAESLVLDTSLPEGTLYVGTPGNYRTFPRQGNTSPWRISEGK